MMEDLDKTQPYFALTEDDRSTLITPRDGAVSMATVGGRLENHYPVLEVRGGRGVTGMGVVYIVEDAGRLYAVKTFQRRFARELAFIERFVREARTWMLIGFHPNIVHAYRVEIIDAVPYLFMEYVPGNPEGLHSLAEHLRQGAFSFDKALHFAIQFCEGMAHAVRAVPGLVHRDIKPDNVLVHPDGTLKITDFGLVRARNDDDTALAALARSALENRGKTNLTELGSVFGTPTYMAPEQFQGAQQAGETADIYAFGCCLYEMLGGRAPFRAEDDPTSDRLAVLRRLHLEELPRDIRELRPDCPEALAAITMRCIEKPTDQRWPTFAELLEALLAVHLELVGPWVPQSTQSDAMPHEVAGQMRSITLLDGYAQAIRLKRLREHHEESPYAFHVALASFFHCQHDTVEERVQLERALEARTAERGTEATRRLAELHLDANRPEEALSAIDAMLARAPDAAEEVLECRVRALLAMGDVAATQAMVEGLAPSRRAMWLSMQVARAADDADALRVAARAMLHGALEDLRGAVAICGEVGAPGFAYRADASLLREALALLAPGLDTGALEAMAVFWPDIGGMPDFSGPMAWLSEACTALAGCTSVPEEKRAIFLRVSESLGGNRRMREHREREEFWFWMQQALPTQERCYAERG